MSLKNSNNTNGNRTRNFRKYANSIISISFSIPVYESKFVYIHICIYVCVYTHTHICPGRVISELFLPSPKNNLTDSNHMKFLIKNPCTFINNGKLLNGPIIHETYTWATRI